MTHIKPLDPNISRHIETLLTTGVDVEAVLVADALMPFQAEILAFLKALSSELLNARYQAQPEIIALGFWLRQAKLKQLQQQFEAQSVGLNRALGQVLHFAPANVDTMFVYSWVCSLLLGNCNVVRVSQTQSEVKQALLQAIEALLQQPEHREIALRNQFITYAHNDAVTHALSQQADARVVWGGDHSVAQIRGILGKLRSRDIVFADRYSAAIIDFDAVQGSQYIEQIAEALWRDLVPFEQMACSSPKVLFALGDCKPIPKLAEALEAKAQNQPLAQSRRNEQLVYSQWLQAQGKAQQNLYQGYFSWLQQDAFTPDTIETHCGQGLLLVSPLADLGELWQALDEKCQTLSYWGVDKQRMIKELQHRPITNVERIVPLGQALDFSTQWDGYDLLSQLCRSISIE